MAEWGPGIYENDDAMDWIYDLLESGSLKRVKYALDIIIQDPAALDEIADCRIALAAADLVASLDGDINPNLPEEAEEWVSMMNHSTEGLRTQAEDAVRMILEQSALKVSMQKKGLQDEWNQIASALLVRLE